jgi:hypothetical protein
MHGAIPQLPQYAFMAWCSVKKKKAQGQLYLYLLVLRHRDNLSCHRSIRCILYFAFKKTVCDFSMILVLFINFVNNSFGGCSMSVLLIRFFNIIYMK